MSTTHEATAITHTTRRSTALVRVNRVAARRPGVLYADVALKRAAALLDDVLAAGEAHGVDPDEWTTHRVDLASAALDLVDYGAAYPSSDAAARAALDDVARHLVAAGVDAHRETRTGGRYRVVDAVATTPAWGSDGERLAFGLYTGGWWLWISGRWSMPLRRRPRVVAPFDDDGVGMADVVLAVNRGDHGAALFAS